VVPFYPLPTAVLREIVELKVDALRRRIWASHKISAEFSPGLLDQLAQRCTESETGARTVDHILRGSLMPALGQRLLEALAAGQQPHSLRVAPAAAGWDIELS
jgi:type VI secretion system protein VasG